MSSGDFKCPICNNYNCHLSVLEHTSGQIIAAKIQKELNPIVSDAIYFPKPAQ